MNKQFYVYILASQRNGTLYIGVTSNLVRRIWQHKEQQVEGFSKKYGIKNLVHFEVHDTTETAIKRKTDQEMEKGLESATNRGIQSRLARPLWG